MPQQKSKTKTPPTPVRSRTRAKSRDTDLERLVGVRYAQRSAALTWRRRWFAASRTDDEQLLGASAAAAFEHKREMIERVGPKSGAIAGYDPAGAGSPWFCIGPRNVNGA